MADLASRRAATHGSRDSVRSGEAAADREGGRLGPAADVELPVEIRDVALDRVDRDSEAGRDLAVRGARGNLAKHLRLARREGVAGPGAPLRASGTAGGR